MAVSRPLVWIYSLAGAKVVPVHELASLVLEDRLGDLETLTFTMRADDLKAFAIIPDRIVEQAGRFYRITELRQYRDGAQALLEVTASALWTDLGDRARPGSFSILGVTPLAGLTQILIGTGWTAAVTPSDAALYSMEDVDSSVLALIRRWASIVGREVRWDTAALTVSLVPRIGVDNGIGFRWGNNLRAVDRRYKPPTATRLYPFGAGDLEVTNVNPLGTNYVEDFSWYTAQGLTLAEARAGHLKERTWSDERYLLALNLYDAALRRLAVLAQPTISYELTVADLFRALGTDEIIALGDTVRVQDPAFGIDLATRIVRFVQDRLRPQDNQLELEYLQPGLGDLSESATGSARSIDYNALSVLVDTNIAIIAITSTTTPLANIQITASGESSVVAGGTFVGTATGSGVVRFSIAVDGIDEVPTYDVAFDAAVATQVHYSWPTFATGIDASGTATVSWRARVVSGTGTISVAVEAARGWLLARGALGAAISSSPNQAIEESVPWHTSTPTDGITITFF